MMMPGEVKVFEPENIRDAKQQQGRTEQDVRPS
jgi:hypothetical protein